MIEREIINNKEVDCFKYTDEIKYDKNSFENSRDYWNTIFNSESDKMSDDKLYEVMTYCDESDFDFTGIVDDKTKKILEQYTVEEWKNLDDEKRYEHIMKLAECIGDNLGLENTPEIEFVEIQDECFGYFSERGNYIAINIQYLDDYKEIVDTVAHESRHAYQKERADKLENEQDELYKFNFEHYVSTEYDSEGKCINFLDYYCQYIEVEARAYAGVFAAEVS